MTDPHEAAANSYLQFAEEARAAQAEKSRVEAQKQERAHREAEQVELAVGERAERHWAAVEQAARAVRVEAGQAAEALRQSGLSTMTILSEGKPVQGWIMWRKWRGSYIEYNSVQAYEASGTGGISANRATYPEHVFGFILSAGGSILAYQDVPGSMKAKIPEEHIVACRDATDEELAYGCPRGATELTRGFFNVPKAELNDRDPNSAVSRWRKLFEELIADVYRRMAPPEPQRKIVVNGDEAERLKAFIVTAPNAQWIARRRGPVSYTRPLFGKPKPVYQDLDPAVSLGPLNWDFEIRDGSPFRMTADSGLTAKGIVVCLAMPAYTLSSSLQDPVLPALQRVARSLGLIP